VLSRSAAGCSSRALALPSKWVLFPAKLHCEYRVGDAQGLIISTIRESLFCGLAILALPLLTWRALGAGREERVMAIALAVCTIFVAVVSGKPGAVRPIYAAYPVGALSRGQAVLPGGRCAAERDNKKPAVWSYARC